MGSLPLRAAQLVLVVLGGAVVAVSSLPVWHMDRPVTAAALLLRVAMVVNGILDHLALVGVVDEPERA